MNLDLADALPVHWKPAVYVGAAICLGCTTGFTYLFNTKADHDDALTKEAFYQYMDGYRLEQKRDFQRLEDKIDGKADKP